MEGTLKKLVTHRNPKDRLIKKPKPDSECILYSLIAFSESPGTSMSCSVSPCSYKNESKAALNIEYKV